jgi:tetraacyldisaccharide 4'-kinase
MKAQRIELLDHANGPTTPPQSLTAFCGIGNPSAFFETVAQTGHHLTTTRVFPDHHNYVQADLDALAETAKRDCSNSLITTSKDAVKLASLHCELPIYVLHVEIEIANATALAALIYAAVNKT